MAGEGSFRERPGRPASSRWEGRRSIGGRDGRRVVYGYGPDRQSARDDLEQKVKAALARGFEYCAVKTVAEWMAWWIDVELADRVADGRLAATTRKSYADKARLWVSPAGQLGSVRLDQLSAAQVRRWLSRMRAGGQSDHSRGYAHTVLRAALTVAVRYELVPVNVAALVEPPRTAKRDRRAEVTIDHARALVAASRGREMEALYLMLLHTPLRPGEPCGAEWAHLDLDGGSYAVRANLVRLDGSWLLHDLKGHRARSVPLHPTVVAALRAHRGRQREA